MSERFDALTHALIIIEQRLSDEITPQQIADACHYSLSGMQRIFSHTFHMGLSDYIVRRRITRAARDLLDTDDRVLTIALRYGFQSHEVFTRAFRRIWGETPSQFRAMRSFADIFPRLTVSEGGSHMGSKRFDVTEFYDAIKTMKNTYAILFDTCALMEINNRYGTVAGDLVIAECLNRIDACRSEDMFMCRIGGDEYILLTGCAAEEDARLIAKQVLSRNGDPIESDGTQIPVSMRYALTPVSDTVSADLLVDMAKHATGQWYEAHQ